MEQIIKRIAALDNDSLRKLENFLSKLEDGVSFPSHVYVDGGCVKGCGAYAWAIPGGSSNVTLIDGKTTNNVAELMAIEDAIKNTEGDITIFSDSDYAIKCLSVWCPKWKKNGWKKANGQPVKNQEIIEKVYDLIESSERDISFQHVPAHKGDKYNEMVDSMCTRAIAGKALADAQAAFNALNVSEE